MSEARCSPCRGIPRQTLKATLKRSLKQSGYRSLPLADYDKDLCLIPHEVLQFIQATQPKEYQKLRTPVRGGDTRETPSSHKQSD